MPNLGNTPRPGEEEVEQTDDVIHGQSSSETELSDNLPAFDIERTLSKLRSNSTDDSTEDVVETVTSGRRSSAKLGNQVVQFISHYIQTLMKFLLLPLLSRLSFSFHCGGIHSQDQKT